MTVHIAGPLATAQLAAIAATQRTDELVARLEALAAEADAGGDHATAERIRTALYDEARTA